MSYRLDTMIFWRIGYKPFHGKFIRFMSGDKSQRSNGAGEIMGGEIYENYITTPKSLSTFSRAESRI